MGTDFPKEGRIERLRERLLFDVVRSKVAEDAGFHIPPRIDMKILPPCCNAALGEASIIPEIDKEHRLGSPKVREPLSRPVPLPRGDHEGEVRISPDGNIMEVPEKDTSLLH